MIGMPNSAPNTPGFVIVNVPPETSSGLSCLRARAVREVGDRAAQPEQVLLVRVLDHRDDQAPVERHGDADVDVLVVDDVSPSTDALTTGTARSASTAALRMNDR